MFRIATGKPSPAATVPKGFVFSSVRLAMVAARIWCAMESLPQGAVTGSLIWPLQAALSGAATGRGPWFRHAIHCSGGKSACHRLASEAKIATRLSDPSGWNPGPWPFRSTVLYLPSSPATAGLPVRPPFSASPAGRQGSASRPAPQLVPGITAPRPPPSPSVYTG